MILYSAYRLEYDPFPILERLHTDKSNAICELWENLYHQGDVGTASYASVSKLIETGELSLVAAIEVARNSQQNPALPVELETSYFQSLKKVLDIVPTSEEQFQSYYIIHASLNGQYKLAKALLLLNVDEFLSEYG